MDDRDPAPTTLRGELRIPRTPRADLLVVGTAVVYLMLLDVGHQLLRLPREVRREDAVAADGGPPARPPA